MSSVDRMTRLGLGHLLGQPDAVQREALEQLHAKLEAKWALQKAAQSPQSQPKPAKAK